MPLESLLPFLPETAVRHNRTLEPNRSIRLPLNQILPQLTRGRVVTALGDLLSQLPAEMVTVPMPYTGSEKVILPLEHVVAHLPAETLHPRSDQRTIELNEADIPAPFVEGTMAAQLGHNEPPLIVQTPVEQTSEGRYSETSRALDPIQPQSGEFRLPENLDDRPLFEPASTRSIEPKPQEPKAERPAQRASSEPNWRGQWIYVSIADIIDAIPDKYLFDSRESLKAQVDPARKVPVAIEDVVGQLATGRFTLVLSKLKSLLPEGFLVTDVAEGEVSIGLDKVIDQLPESAFTQEAGQQDPWKELDSIPTPFHEKTEDSPSVAEEPKAEETVQPASIPQGRTSASNEGLIPMQLEEEAPVDSNLLAEVNRIEPLFVEKSQQAETVAPAEPAAEAIAPVVEPVTSPVEEKKEDVVAINVQPPVAELPKDVPIATQEAAAVEEAPAPVEQTAAFEGAAAKETEPVAKETEAPAPQAEEEGDLDSITLSADVPAEAQPVAVSVSKEQIAEALNNLNTWSEEDLHQHSLGPTLTQRIMEWRQHRGGFKDLRELMQIAGIGPKLFQRVLGFLPEALEDQSRAINRLLGVSEDHEMTLQEIVKCASKLQGVEGCIVAMSDGIYMTGDLPAHLDSQRVSAFAPQLFARVAQYVRELNVGTARRFTIFTDAQPITIFKSGDLFFIVIHKANRFSKVLLNKCERISLEISRLCSKETANR